MIQTIHGAGLEELSKPELRDRALGLLEGGDVVHLPDLRFGLRTEEEVFLDPTTVVKRPSRARDTGRPTLLYDSTTRRLRGGNLKGVARGDIQVMMDRFAGWARDLVLALFPGYERALETEYTTFRPCARSRVQGLHVDATIGRPTQGRAWLRVFTNINAGGHPRIWHVGEHFEPFARRFVPRMPAVVRETIPGSGWLVEKLGFSHGRPNAYDLTMRRLRDLMKQDKEYQRTAPRTIFEFAPGSTWIAFTDLVLHGAREGQHSLDQSWLLPVSGMRDPERSSLRILERLTGRSLS